MQRVTSAFGAQSTAAEVAQGHDLGGRTAIVTGGGGGIGRETARVLAANGADVVIAVRNAEQGSAAVAELERDAPGRISYERLDLASFASIRTFAERWGDRRLDLLIDNAGIMACPQGVTRDGLELQLGTNHFGHYLLTMLLVPALERGAIATNGSARVVVLSSGAHRRSAMNFDDPHYRSRAYDKWEAYGQSKTANALFAVGFSDRFRGRGIFANSVMPGVIHTSLSRHLAEQEISAIMDRSGANGAPLSKSIPQGAATSVWAALGSELSRIGGLYLEDCAQAEDDAQGFARGVAPHALDREAADRLWALSQDTTGV